MWGKLPIPKYIAHKFGVAGDRDLADVGMEGAGIADLQAHIEGALDIVGGDGGAVAPLGGGIDLHGQLGLLGVPAVVSARPPGSTPAWPATTTTPRAS